MSKDGAYITYVDTGGTFSDAVVVEPDGTFTRGKADTLPERLEKSFFNCIEVAAENKGKSLKEVIANSAEIGYGTTQGTNIIAAELPGPKLGMITTKGIEDRTLYWRLRSAGLTKVEAMHMAASGHPKPIIPRTLIKGVTERIDSLGEVVFPLREGEVRKAVKELLDERIEGIAICFLWSFFNPVHEQKVRDIIQEMAPGVTVALSSEVSPTIREYPRFTSTIIDLHIGKALKELLEKIEGRLRKYGYKKPLLVMQAAGGVAQTLVVKPGTTLHSGPVGGLTGVEFLKSIYGFPNALGSDVGGTSFDVTFSPEKGEELKLEPVVGRYEIATPMREIITMGAGGGTIAWVDPVTRTLRVGPQSAGGVPGPACYDIGGAKPTVTDADVVLNRIDADYFLGGRKKLNRKTALAAIEEKIAKPLKMDTIEAAYGICEIVDTAMNATVKAVLATRGADPSKFVLFAFGGAGPTHCAGYSAGLGFPKVIIPPFAAVFSAFGAATADIKHRFEASPYLLLPNLPFDATTSGFEADKITLAMAPSWAISRFNSAFADLEERAFKDLDKEGFKREEVTFKHEIMARYGGQLWELRITSPVSRIKTNTDLALLVKAFENEYKTRYSEIVMSPAGGIEVISIGLVASAPAAKPRLVRKDLVGKDPSSALKGERNVYFDGKWLSTKVYEVMKLKPGNRVEGPAIIEAIDTTLVIPKDRRVTMDEYSNMVMEER
ncbi:MAG TPA: hydantoinase/oxoprolinase family protein [Syntrophales bacterium]|nr:hydantoinase/oxoprolinase family protein [Syntrophales bacterium]